MKVGKDKVYPKMSQRVFIHCPGCHFKHSLKVEDDLLGPKIHTFNGDYEKPTFSPSLLWNFDPEIICHSLIKDGMIQFLNDCTHELKNKTVPLPDVEEGK